jgi:hypothetical protein
MGEKGPTCDQFEELGQSGDAIPTDGTPLV